MGNPVRMKIMKPRKNLKNCIRSLWLSHLSEFLVVLSKASSIAEFQYNVKFICFLLRAKTSHYVTVIEYLNSVHLAPNGTHLLGCHSVSNNLLDGNILAGIFHNTFVYRARASATYYFDFFPCASEDRVCHDFYTNSKGEYINMRGGSLLLGHSA